MLTRLLLCLTTMLASPAVASEGVVPTLFHSGRIHLMDGKGTVVDALLVSGGRVAAVGTTEELLGREEASSWRQVDLAGHVAVPGLQDSHGHLEDYGASLEGVDLRGCLSYGELVERVRLASLDLEEGTWILGRGWDQNLWPGRELPHHAALSEAVPDNPVYLERVDGHSALLNQAALELAELDGELYPPPRVHGGRILLDEDRYATGVLIDRAVERVAALLPVIDDDERLARLMRVQDELLARGLTAVHDMGCAPSFVPILQRARDEEKLRIRVVAYIDGTERLTEEMVASLPLRPDPGDWLSVIGIELRVDGSLGTHGAALIDDYSDSPGELGHLLLREDELARRLLLASRHGLQPAVHAVGDRANRLVLDVFESLQAAMPGFRSLRPRIEHAQVVTTKDWPRFPALGVIPSMQPVGATDDLRWVPDRLGSERTRGAYAWGRLAPVLGRLAFGTDAPVSDPDPLQGLYACRVRQDRQGLPDEGFLRQQVLDGRAALAGFTLGAAYASHQEDRRGRLLPGFAADLTVLDFDPLAEDPEGLLEASVAMTVVNGEILYRRVGR